MLADILIRVHRLALLVILTVALIATGFGHRMPSDQTDALVLALENGATLADFCGGEPGAGGGTTDTHCLACQIATNADLPPATGVLIDLDLTTHAKVVAPQQSCAGTRVLDLAHTPRAPPSAALAA